LIRKQIQITIKQACALRRLAAKEGKSEAVLIRLSLDFMLKACGINDQKFYGAMQLQLLEN
jgi:hypothetical protein